jgi:hypothetical protein
VLLAVLMAAGAGGVARADNPFGVMLFPNPGEDFSLALARARGLGVSWFRPPTIALGDWNAAGPCPSCALYAHSGLKIAITVRNTAGGAARQPAHAPADIARFVATMKSVVAAWQPSLVAVETDENTTAFYMGSDKDYLAELAAACEVAHKAGALCVNGGITGDAASFLTWSDFLEQGKPDRACDFATRALPRENLCAVHSAGDVPMPVRERLLGDAGALVRAYHTAAIDLVNFHWFGPDSRAFAEVASTLAKLTGKPAMTNELGQRPGADDPAAVRPLLRAAVAEGIRVAIWYSIDTRDTVSLFGRDGLLRPTGWEFQRQLSGLR